MSFFANSFYTVVAAASFEFYSFFSVISSGAFFYARWVVVHARRREEFEEEKEETCQGRIHVSPRTSALLPCVCFEEMRVVTAYPSRRWGSHLLGILQITAKEHREKPKEMCEEKIRETALETALCLHQHRYGASRGAFFGNLPEGQHCGF